MIQEEFYKFAYDAWDEGTHDLSLEEEAAYLRVCNQIYRRKGPIPNSERQLCSLWRCHPNRARKLIQTLIDRGKITLTAGGFLTNERATRELDARQTVSTQKAYAGRIGGIRSGEVRKNSSENNVTPKLDTAASEQEKRREEKISPPNGGAPELFENSSSPPPEEKPDARVYRRGREILGKNAGGVVKKLLTVKASISGAMSALEAAAGTADPASYIGAIIRPKTRAMMDDGIEPVWRQM